MSKNAIVIAKKWADDPNRKPISPELARALAWLKRVSLKWEMSREKRRIRRLKAQVAFNQRHGSYEEEGQ